MLKIENLTKKYGSKIALDNFSLSLKDSGIYIVIGENGAGKTTLFNCIAGKKHYQNGTIEPNNDDKINFVHPLTKQFNLPISQLLSAANDFQKGFNKNIANEILNKMDLNTNQKFNSLSTGQKTLFNVILSMSSDKQIILLDEPMLGLDPLIREKLNDLIFEMQEKQEKIILISTHLISEVERIAQNIIIIHKGHKFFESSYNDFSNNAIRVSGLSEEIKKAVDLQKAINVKTSDGLTVADFYGENIKQNNQIKITNLGLEQFFVSLISAKKGEN